MIYSVTGKLGPKGGNFTAIDIGGLSFKILTHRRTLGSLPALGSQFTFFCRLYVREDALELYGFVSSDELRFFELLNSVAGVGPRSALAILDVAELKQLTAAIKEGRPDLLTRASGIGQKTAERIVLELRNRVEGEKTEATVGIMESDADILEALVGLGYRKDQAKAALQKIGEKIQNTETRLKEALKILGGKNR